MIVSMDLWLLLLFISINNTDTVYRCYKSKFIIQEKNFHLISHELGLGDKGNWKPN